MFKNKYITIVLFLAILLTTVALTVIGGLATSVVQGYGNEKKPSPKQEIPQLSKQLASRLDSALSPEYEFDFEGVNNPFADRTGVSLDKQKDNNSNDINRSGNKSSKLSRNLNISKRNTKGTFQVSDLPKTRQALPSPTPPFGYSQENDDRSKKLKERDKLRRLGKDVPELASYFDIEEIRPYGIIGSGKLNMVKIYVPSTEHRFSVRRGTKFRNGVIIGIDDEGVKFETDSGEIFYQKWVSKTSENSEPSVFNIDPKTLR